MEKEGKKNKNEESSSSGSNRRKISQSLWCVFCSALPAGAEKARVVEEEDNAKLLQFVLQEYQKALHKLN